MSELELDKADFYEDNLALSWTLSADDIQFILSECNGAHNRLYFSAQLKSLQTTGIFLATHDHLENKVIDYLAKQLDVAIKQLRPVSRNANAIYQRKIKFYLGYKGFSNNAKQSLKAYISKEMTQDLYSLETLKIKAYVWFKHHKIMRPSMTVLNRIIASYRKTTIAMLYQKITNKLTNDQKEKMLSFLKRQPALLSKLNYLKKSPPEATATKINQFIKRYTELSDLGLDKIDFSDVSESVFVKLETLAKTYDTYSLNRIQSKDKKYALLLCILTSASSRMLDHILNMNDALLIKKERISRNKLGLLDFVLQKSCYNNLFFQKNIVSL